MNNSNCTNLDTGEGERVARDERGDDSKRNCRGMTVALEMVAKIAAKNGSVIGVGSTE